MLECPCPHLTPFAVIDKPYMFEYHTKICFAIRLRSYSDKDHIPNNWNELKIKLSFKVIILFLLKSVQYAELCTLFLFYIID